MRAALRPGWRGVMIACACLGLCSAIPASARTYTPPSGKVWAGLTGGTSIQGWQKLTNHHPPVFEEYMTWNSRTAWLANPHPAFRSRLALHMSTAPDTAREA